MKRLQHAVLASAWCLLLLSFLMSAPARGTVWEVGMGSDGQFHPSALTVSEGDSVYWMNQDAFDHTSTSGTPDCVTDGLWDSGNVASGMTWGRKFDQTGSYPYICIYHCAFGMYGTITVEPATPAETWTWGKVRAIYR